MARRTSAEVELASRIFYIELTHKEELRRIAKIDRWIDLMTLRKNGATYEEIGLARDISGTRVRQLLDQAIKVATKRIEREAAEEKRYYGL